MGPPIDKGWAWMVCVGCHIIILFVMGCIRTLGVLLVEFQETMHCSTFEISMLFAVISITFSITTPAANALAAYCTSRVVIMAGGILTSVGLLCAYFATNMIVVITLMGTFMGVGVSLQFSPALIILGRFFNKRRSLATGIAMSGASIGQLTLPALITYLVDWYTFRGALLILSAIFLHVCVGAMLITPLSFYDAKKKPKTSVIYKKQHTVQLQTPVDENQNLDTNGMNAEQNVEEEKRESSLLQAQDPTVSENTTVDITEVKPSSKDMFQAVCCCCLPCLQHNGPKTCNWKLFCNALFLIYVIGIATGNTAYLDLLMFLPAYFKDIGISKYATALLLAIAGVLDIFGRLIGGWFADLGIIKRHNIMAFSILVIGVTTAISLQLPSFTSAVVHVTVLGFAGGFYMALFAVVIIDFLGLQLMPSAFGMAMLTQGLVNTMLPGLLGMLRDVTSSYMATLHCCVALMLVCSTAFASEPLARWYERRKIKGAGGHHCED